MTYSQNYYKMSTVSHIVLVQLVVSVVKFDDKDCATLSSFICSVKQQQKHVHR